MKKKLILAGLATLAIAGAIFQNFTLQGLFTKSPLPQAPYIRVPQIAANGHALTWDGRVMVQTIGLSFSAPFSGTVLAKYPAGFQLSTDQSVTVGDTTFVMQGDGNAVLYRNSKALFNTGTLGQCKKCKFVFQGDGNLVIYNTENGAPIWSSSTNAAGFALAILKEEPYLALINENGKLGWPSGGGIGWAARVFRPESMKNVDNNNAPALEAALKDSFTSNPAYFAMPETFTGDKSAVSVLNLSSLNALAISAAPGYIENPYRSDANGKPVLAGAYETYKARIFTQYYGKGHGDNPLGFFPATIIVKNPRTETADVHRIYADGQFEMMKDKNGNLIHAIEPTATFDGRLVVYQNWDNKGHAGILYYTYHNSDSPGTTGWSVPDSVTNMYKNPELALRYPVARHPIRDANGNIMGPLPAAYPWISLSGEDIMFSGSIYKDGARRAGTSMVGASTKGLARLIDGGVNNARFGGIPRLFTSSPGRTPGMWSPMEFNEKKTFPLTDKKFTYPVFGSNAGSYFEASFEETVDTNYDVYFDMTEPLDYGRDTTGIGNYNTNFTTDVSGYFHIGQMNGNALYSEEAYPSECTNLVCEMKDVRSDKANLFSGQPMYFKGGGAITSAATSVTGHTILGGARALSLSFAIKPIISGAAAIMSKGNTFSIQMNSSRVVEAKFSLVKSGVVSSYTVSGPQLKSGQWNHVAVTLNIASNVVRFYLDGVLTGTVTVPSNGSAINLGNDALVVGPVNSSSSEILYALDQVGVSRVVRTHDEIRVQAGLQVNRMLKPSLKLPSGLKIKDVQNDLLGRSYNNNARELGRHLFFDNRLSRANNVSCASCHNPDRSFTESLSLHPNLLAKTGGSKKILRNTPSVLNALFKGHFMADARHPRLIDQAASVLKNPEEMGADINAVVAKISSSAQYKPLFDKAFPGKGVSSATIASALEEFQLSLVSGNSRFDEFMAGNLNSLNSSEKRGMGLFFGKARCAECHSGSNFTDGFVHKLGFVSDTNEEGVVDTGLARVTGYDKDIGKFATPSLRNIAGTAPYFHNGSVNSLAEVVNLYNNAGATDDSLNGIFLSSNEEGDLVDFLESLTGEVPSITSPTFTDMPGELPTTSSFSAGMTLAFGQKIMLADVSIEVVSSGALIVKDPAGKTLWTTGALGGGCDSSCKLVFQADGNLVLYKGSTALWHTETVTGINKGSKFSVFDREPYLRVMTASGSIAWASSTNFASGLSLYSDQFIQIGPVSTGLKLFLQGDGNLVLYKADLLPANALWSSKTTGKNCSKKCLASFQDDHNFVLYDSAGKAYWASSSNTKTASKLLLTTTTPYLQVKESSGSINWYSGLPLPAFTLKPGQQIKYAPNSILAFQGDGNLVNYLNGKAIWASNTAPYNCHSLPCTAGLSALGNLYVRVESSVKFQSATNAGTGATLDLSATAPHMKILRDNGSIEWATSYRFDNGFTLKGGQYVRLGSVATGLTLVMQGDGNLVLYKGEASVQNALWSSVTAGRSCGVKCKMVYNNKEIIVYDGDKPVWNSGNAGKEAAQLVLSSTSPYLFIQENVGHIHWFTQLPMKGFNLTSHLVYRFNGDMLLAMQGDANVVLYKAGKPLWASNTSGKGDCSKQKCNAAFQGDGNFVLYIDGKPMFASDTSGLKNPTFTFEKKAPYLVIRDEKGVVKWSQGN